MARGKVGGVWQEGLKPYHFGVNPAKHSDIFLSTLTDFKDSAGFHHNLVLVMNNHRAIIRYHLHQLQPVNVCITCQSKFNNLKMQMNDKQHFPYFRLIYRTVYNPFNCNPIHSLENQYGAGANTSTL